MWPLFLHTKLAKLGNHPKSCQNRFHHQVALTKAANLCQAGPPVTEAKPRTRLIRAAKVPKPTWNAPKSVHPRSVQ